MQQKQRGTLRAKIIGWSFIPTTIILVAVTLVTFQAYQKVTEELVIQRDQEVTRLSAMQLSSELAPLASELQMLARSVADPDPEQQREKLKQQRNRLLGFDGGIVILDRFGRVSVTEPDRPEIMGQDWSDRPYFNQLLRSQQPVFSDIVADGAGGRDVVALAMQITNDSGEYMGALIGMFELGAPNFSPFYGYIVKLRLLDSENSYLVDSHLRIIYHADSERIGQQYVLPDETGEHIKGNAGFSHSHSPDGSHTVASYAPVPNTPWILVTQQSWSSLLQSSRSYQEMLLFLLAIGVGLPALVVNIGVQRITRPIQELIVAAQQVAAGKFGQTITATTGDEVEELAHQFNLMSAQLQESYSTLERKVADRTRELATLNAIAAVVSRSLDLHEILSNALTEMLKVMAMDVGKALLIEQETNSLIVIARQGVPDEYLRNINNLPREESIALREARAGQPVYIYVHELEEGPLKRMAEQEQLQVLVSVPLVSKGVLHGAINMGARAKRTISKDDLSLLAAIGQQIGVAVENASLYQAERERLDEVQRRRAVAEGLRDILAILNSNRTLEEILNHIAAQAFRILRSDAVAIFRMESSQGPLRVQAACCLDESFVQNMEIPLGQGAVGVAATTRRPVTIEDAVEALSRNELVIPDEMRLLVKATATPIRAILSVPLLARDSIYGAISLYYQQPCSFSQEEIELAVAFADQAALAIENARLHEQIEQLAIIEERSRLARELHDSVTQSLYSLTLLSEAGRRLATTGDLAKVTTYLGRLGETAQQALKEMRLLVYELRPLALEQAGLIGALQHRLDAVEKRAGMEVRLLVEGEVLIPPSIEEGLYRIAQEALNNALKHAAASEVIITIRGNDQSVRLSIADDGQGFDPTTASSRGGMGLVSIRERVERLNGRLEILSSPGHGTTIQVDVQLPTRLFTTPRIYTSPPFMLQPNDKSGEPGRGGGQEE